MRTIIAGLGCLLILANHAAGFVDNPGLKAMADASTDIVVAEVLDTSMRQAIEGSRGNARLKVLRPLKGRLESGQVIEVYHHLLANYEATPATLEKPKFEKKKALHGLPR